MGGQDDDGTKKARARMSRPKPSCTNWHQLYFRAGSGGASISRSTEGMEMSKFYSCCRVFLAAARLDG